jgi:16S rRNA (cytosine1402-N4)-methyltransferase
MSSNHITVLLDEATSALKIKPDSWYVDATFGSGGHTEKILASGGCVIGLDFDLETILRGEETFSNEIKAGKLILIRENFTELDTIIKKLQDGGKVSDISGILFDFGTSTDQLMSSERGFSFTGSGTLDMRMDTRLGVTAADLLSAIPEKQLAQLFFEYGGEHDSRKIAKAIKESEERISTTKQLADIIFKVKGQQRTPLHPATKVFQALRIATNTELDNIQQALPKALEFLKKDGVIVTISFHEGEDEIVKTKFAQWEKAKKILNSKKPLTPGEDELRKNPRSRSAKLRVATKL